MLLGSYQKLKGDCMKVFVLNDGNIEINHVVKYLGVLIDKHLNWDCQVKVVW